MAGFPQICFGFLVFTSTFYVWAEAAKALALRDCARSLLLDRAGRQARRALAPRRVRALSALVSETPCEVTRKRAHFAVRSVSPEWGRVDPETEERSGAPINGSGIIRTPPHAQLLPKRCPRTGRRGDELVQTFAAA
eukprot:3299703-Pleurochrysis_carterae.AAC.3